MFIFGNHIYTHSTKKLIAFTIQEVLQCLEILQTFRKRKKKGYFVGYLTYECGILLQFYNKHNIPITNNHSLQENTPLLYFEHFAKRKKIKKITPKNKGTKPLFSIKKSLDKNRYESDFQKIKDNIANGHTYQINYTQEIELFKTLPFSSLQYFHMLCVKQDTKYKAYIKNNFLEILSFSPELFFKIKKHKITTQPMKGTAKRVYKNTNTQDINNEPLFPTHINCTIIKKYKESKKKIPKTLQIDSAKDLENAIMLANDKKNQSENVMIVDLLRNDLSRIALQGTLKVKELFAIHTYPTLHQMVSTIQAKLPKNSTLLDIFQTLFPCGSITGAPKLKTIEIINNLEKHQRGVYCGAIGVISAKKVLFNIPIRTLVKYHNESFYRYGVGSGVVWDSKMHEEFNELQLKYQFLF